MIISEKQILLLIGIARDASELARERGTGEWNKYSCHVSSLLDDINNQQSKELKEIE